MGQVKSALAGWLEREARPRGGSTIMTTGGDLWWSDTVERGREDLLLVLGRMKGKALARGGAESMSDLEAYRIAVFEQTRSHWWVRRGDRGRRMPSGSVALESSCPAFR